MEESRIREILYDYQLKRDRSKELIEDREKNLYENFPDIRDISEEIKGVGFEMMRKSLSGNSSDDLDMLEAKQTQLIEVKNRLMKSHGFPDDYLEVKYECDKCRDTGFLSNGRRCSCLEQVLINDRYKMSNLENVLSKENFLRFDFSIFSDEVDPEFGMSQKENIERIYYKVQYFLRDFDKKGIDEKKNIIFTGPPGNGKTYFCSSIAKELMDRGKTVIYQTSFRLLDIMESYKFKNKDIDSSVKISYQNLFDSDLLIIDDLGSEMPTSFSVPELFNIINSRINSGKSVIISTNLNMVELGNIYTDRILSRIAGNFQVYEFFGPDLRYIKR